MHPSTYDTRRAMLVFILAALAAGCGDSDDRGAGPLAPAAALQPGSPPPPPLQTVAFGPHALELWPYTGMDFSGQPLDPINLLFVGEADIPNVRSALFALDGDRAAFGLPFDCTWRDAAGGIQASWADGDWTGSVVQLECGDYEGIRFHLRLFPAGDWTIANTHFEVLIPGTTDHQVLSWTLAKQLVAADLQRTGLLDSSAPFGAVPGLTAAPTFREIPQMIYNGLPAALRLLVTGTTDDATGPVGIPNDGIALIANVASRAVPVPGTARHDFVVDFDQVVPKPLCAASETDWVHAAGPVRFTQRVVTNPDGNVSAQIQVTGSLDVTPVTFGTWAPAGPTLRGQVTDHYAAATLGRGGRISSDQLRLLTAAGGGESKSQRIRMQVGPDGRTLYSEQERCGK